MPKQRCGAKIPHTPSKLVRAAACGDAALAAYLKRDRCKNYPLKGKSRCRYHGGRSRSKRMHEHALDGARGVECQGL